MSISTASRLAAGTASVEASEPQAGSAQDRLWAALGLDERSPQAPTRGLPLARPAAPRRRSTSHYVVTSIDERGRVADRSPLRLLRWQPGRHVAIRVAPTVIVVVASAAGRHVITGQGHLRLPTALRRACRIEPGDRLLVAAYPEPGLLLAYPMPVLDDMVLAYHAGTSAEQGPR